MAQAVLAVRMAQAVLAVRMVQAVLVRMAQAVPAALAMPTERRRPATGLGELQPAPPARVVRESRLAAVLFGVLDLDGGLDGAASQLVLAGPMPTKE